MVVLTLCVRQKKIIVIVSIVFGIILAACHRLKCSCYEMKELNGQVKKIYPDPSVKGDNPFHGKRTYEGQRIEEGEFKNDNLHGRGINRNAQLWINKDPRGI